MNCNFRDAGEPVCKGRKKFACTRCPRVLKVPFGNRIAPVTCRAWFPLWHEFGQWASLLLFVATGINRRRWSWVKARLGLKPCKCGERAAKLDSLGQRLAQWLTR